MGASQRRHLVAVDAADSPGRAPRRIYSDAFKARAVGMVRSDHPIAAVARELGIARNTLKSWLEKPGIAGQPIKLADAVLSGDERQVLVGVRDAVAAKIDSGVSAKDLAPLVRQLKETMREIAAFDDRAKSTGSSSEVGGSRAANPDEAGWDPKAL